MVHYITQGTCEVANYFPPYRTALFFFYYIYITVHFNHLQCRYYTDRRVNEKIDFNFNRYKYLKELSKDKNKILRQKKKNHQLLKFDTA